MRFHVYEVFIISQKKYNKSYESPDEEKKRHGIFKGNYAQIVAHNTKYDAGSVGYDLLANAFCDLTPSEFESMHTGLQPQKRSTGAYEYPQQGGKDSAANVFMPAHSLESEVEDEVDWRKKGAVTPVKSQGKSSCGSKSGLLELQRNVARLLEAVLIIFRRVSLD